MASETHTGGQDLLNGLRVLLVDDDADAREPIALVIQHYGATVTAVASAAEALDVLQRDRPDVLISDIRMPGNGLELIARVRALAPDAGGNTPAGALTAYARPEDQERILQAGFQLHIPKPIEGVQLAMAIASLAGRHPSGG